MVDISYAPYGRQGIVTCVISRHSEAQEAYFLKTSYVSLSTSVGITMELIMK